MKNFNRFQLFAEESEEPVTNTEPEKKYTDEDVDRLISEKFAKWEKKRQEEEARKVKEAQEAEKLKNLSESEKTNKRLEEMEAQLSSYREKEALTAMEREARKLFQDAELTVPDELVRLCTSAKAEETKTHVDQIIALVRAEVKKAAQASVAKGTPKTGNKPTITKEQILAVKNNIERQRLMAENWGMFQKGN